MRRQRDQRIAMICHTKVRHHHQTPIRFARERIEHAIEVIGSAHSGRDRRHREGMRRGLDRPHEQVGERRAVRVEDERDPLDVRRSLLEHLQPFGSDRELEAGEAGEIPPGCARFGTRPSPTGSVTCVNTIGATRLCSRSAAVTGVLLANDWQPAERGYQFPPSNVGCHATLPPGMQWRDDTTLGSAALRDFKPAYVGSGSWLRKKRFRSGPKLLPTGWRAASSAR